ncbi:Hypothetical_protein [Hexamita inflata]|uniref:Hypothetical_protein n=1 Tax=Hexamita inflata TaxID=28002 RepID=A0AA86TS02_9EUKA|nr:Hypothetical protein HINF_LOCUS12137 [Hexamita inflata]
MMELGTNEDLLDCSDQIPIKSISNKSQRLPELFPHVKRVVSAEQIELRKSKILITQLMQELEQSKQSYEKQMRKISDQYSQLKSESASTISQLQKQQDDYLIEKRKIQRDQNSMIDAHIKDFNQLVSTIDQFRKENINLSNQQQENKLLLSEYQHLISDLEDTIVKEQKISKAAIKERDRLQTMIQEKEPELDQIDDEEIVERLANEKNLRKQNKEQDIIINQQKDFIMKLKDQLFQKDQVITELVETRTTLEQQNGQKTVQIQELNTHILKLKEQDNISWTSQLEVHSASLAVEVKQQKALVEKLQKDIRKYQYLENNKELIEKYQNEKNQLQLQLQQMHRINNELKNNKLQNETNDKMQKLTNLLSPERKAVLRGLSGFK